MDVHLMIENPSEKVDWFLDAGVDIVYIHPEAERYVGKTLARIHGRGAKAGIAINPDTSVEFVAEMLRACDYVLVMTVNPGFAGQRYIESCTDKVRRLAAMKEAYGFKVVIDGACSPERVAELSRLGADGEADAGIVICGTGVGISLAANKVRGIRCCTCSEPYSAQLSKRHNDSNMLAFGARVVGPELAKMIVDAWLGAEFEGGRHQRRIDMIAKIEETQEL
jgi:ribulose-phosphate 3-epimerase